MMKKYAKKYALFFILIAFAITIILWPLATTQSIHSTQEDPGTAESSFTVSLPNITDFVDIAGILASGKYDSFEGLLQEYDLDIDDFPENMQYIYQTYKDMGSDLEAKLINLDDLLYRADFFLRVGEFDETSLKLTNAQYLAEDIEALLEDMDGANEQIIDILGSFAPANQTEETDELWRWLDEDKESLELLKAEYEESAPQNIPTGLDLEVPDLIYPGLPYKVYGQITYDGETPSIERDIKLLWDNEPLDTVYSFRAQGSFEIEVTPDENTIL
ncbi:hypothetical protein ACFLTQ_03385, partial [Chloroflexota bacterium]